MTRAIIALAVRRAKSATKFPNDRCVIESRNCDDVQHAQSAHIEDFARRIQFGQFDVEHASLSITCGQLFLHIARIRIARMELHAPRGMRRAAMPVLSLKALHLVGSARDIDQQCSAMQVSSPLVSEKLHTLDGMRGVAAISVLFLHLGNWIEQRWFFTHGYLAVDFFFCLSGFVMAHAYGRRLTENMTFKDFLVQRVIRLYPIILLGMVLGALYYLFLATLTKNPLFGAPDVGIAFALNLFLIPFYFWPSALGGGIYPLNTPFWSIFFEMIANLTWARFFVRVSPVLLFGIAAVLGLCLFPQYDRIDGGGLIDQFWLGTLRVIVGFSAGLLVHNLYAEKRLDWISGINPWILLVVLLILFSVPNVGGVGYDMVCILVVFPLLTLLGARADGTAGQALLEWLGAISYPLYGIHRPICLALVFVIAPRLHLPHPLIVIVAAIGSVCAAHIAYYYFDEPVRRILRSRVVAFKSSAAPLAAS